ncbi:uncharacterized protein LOC106402720 isoform X2 [Brassica napus]|uniref:uncharacterized protein LOC106402720 isoform X2 n=1 Tax=Brassica napus TaxID=3708 RepID=UPI0020793541|nr:uncharacterized protein LOC106402720 isoform X2 [Brassica napus]XP_048610308.1 uncharacterized protein LOC106402720 isoform X2 [Brassica napus]XP_048610309.1 uncharacterized protein LOC106402720 isoform X2 [Brassica napus]XP_048610310.1 uncharacterized protein LOC106402720 isoform X2 [Brassica napus]XP_048610311.1 uncharacterized protein LOC106402720 isoform X2 [Brassica napus]XP_048610312.1 uncharacterized protein LOC106402720 isoform X2 [Brassica napus]XP_048610313.1 uncharacterized prot
MNLILDDIWVCNIFFDMHDRWRSHTVLCFGDILVYNTFFDMITHLSCPKQAEKGTGEERGYNDPSINDESLAKLEMQQSNLGNCLAASFDIGAVRGSYLSNQKELSNKLDCNRNLTHLGLTSNWNHVQSFSGEIVMSFRSRVILCLLCLKFSEFRISQFYLWRPGEYVNVSDHVFKNSFITNYTDMMHLFLSKEPCADFKRAWKHIRRNYKNEEDKRFKPPDLDQDNHQDVPGFIIIKEAPRDAAYNPKPSRNKFGIRLLLYDNFACANLFCFSVCESGLGNASGVWRAQRISSFYQTNPVSNNAYQRGLQGKCNLIINVNVTDLAHFVADELDLRTNPFQEGGDDMIMDQPNKEDNESMDDPADGGALVISEGPMTRARSKQLKEAIGGLLKTSLKQEESLGRSLINQDTLATIQAISAPRYTSNEQVTYVCSFYLSLVLSHWVSKDRFLMRPYVAFLSLI